MKKAVITALVLAALMSVPAGAEYVVSRNGLNVRERPTINSPVVEVLGFGAEVTPIRNVGKWAKLSNGYVAAEFLQDSNPLDELEYLGDWHITAYAYTGSACANGEYPEAGYTIACNSLPFGTEVYIEGVGFRTVEDRGPAWLGDQWCDLYLGEYDSCVAWGDQTKKVWRVK